MSATPQKSSSPYKPPAYPKSIDIEWDAEIIPKTLPEHFDESVKKYGDRTCLNFLGKKLTYRQVGKMVDRFAKGLQDQGIGPGSTIGLCLPNSPFYVVAYYGALKAGARIANFNPLYAEKEMEDLINDSKTDVMITLTMRGNEKVPLYPKVDKMLDGRTSLKKIIYCELADALPAAKSLAFRALQAFKMWQNKPAETVTVTEDAKHVPFQKLLKSEGRLKPVKISTDDVAVLQYTGGTTGIPKAAMLTHENLSANIQQSTLWFTGGKESQTPEKMLAVLPFFHVFSMTVQLNLTLNIGGELIMIPKVDKDPKTNKTKIEPILKAIQKEKATIFAGVPDLYKVIYEHPTVKDFDLSSLKICVSGGAPLNENISKGFKALTGLDLVEGYGLSETSPLATANPVFGQKKPNSVGLPVPQTEIKLVCLENPSEEAGADKEGEICLRGPQVMKGYWNRPDETAIVMDKDGFFHTGDVGKRDNEGFLYITDRIKDMIIVKGYKVFPRKVEDAVLNANKDKISEVIVIGIPDKETGEAVKMFVVPKEGQTITAEEITRSLGTELSAYEKPKHFEFRDSLPKTMIGKPDRKVIKAEEKAKRQGPKI